MRRLAGGTRGTFALGSTVRFALPAAVIAGCEQVLVSGGPLLVLIAGGPGAAEAAGVLFAATLLVRAPVFLLHGTDDTVIPSVETLLLAEQSIPLALGIADYAYVLQTGRIAIEGEAAELESNRQVQEIYLGIGTREAGAPG